MILSQAISHNELTAIPIIGIADLLHNNYKNKLISSFDKLTTYAAEELNLDASPVLHHLKILTDDLPQFLTPWSYHIYFKLRAAIMNNEVETVKNIITELNEKPITC